MSIKPELGESRYLFEVYAKASEPWGEFRSSRDPKYLDDTAGVLCDGLGGLEEDHVFWPSLHDLQSEMEERREAMMERLSDLNRLLALEQEVLAEAFDDVAKATGLVTDVRLALDMVRELPSPKTIENLRIRVGHLRGGTCETFESEPVAPDAPEVQTRSRFFRAVKIVGRGMVVVTGGALIVANATAEGYGIPDMLGSAATGVQMMHQGLQG